MYPLDQQAEYVITIAGCIDDGLADRFGPVDYAQETDPEGRPVTRLTGTAADQAALVGLIRHLHALGIVLLSVKRVALPARAA